MNTTGEIRQLTPDDHAVQKLDQLLFPRPWKTEDWSGLNPDHHRLWGFFQHDRLIGFALFQIPPFDDTAHLLKILIEPDQRGSGIAPKFWTHIKNSLTADKLRSVYLEVEASNGRAQRFYEKMGFVVLRKVKSYYSDGEAAVMMQLTL